MKQEKFNSLMVAIVAIAAVFGFVSIVWASFSQTLTINGYNATIEASKWDVHFGTVSAIQKSGTAITGDGTGTGTAPVADASSTTLSGFTATLKTPGDTVSFTVPIENAGSYKAKITSITLPTIGTMTSAADTEAQKATDIANITPYVSVSFTYADGTALAIGDELAAANNGTPGTATVKMTVKLDENTPAEKLPTANITVPISATTIVYGQA